MSELTATAAQRAVGFVAARRRGDHAGAEALLGSFESEQDRLLSFCLVAELSMSLLAEGTSDTFDEVAQRISLALASLSSRAST